MKKLLTILLVLNAGTILFAQNTFPASGNVGVGTSTPSYNLDISSGANTTLKIGSTISTGYSDLIFKGSLNSWKVSKYPSGTTGPYTTGKLAFTCNNGVMNGDQSVMTLFLNSGSSAGVAIGSDNSGLFGGRSLMVNGTIGARNLYLSENAASSTYTTFGAPPLQLAVDGRIGARQMFIGAGMNHDAIGLGSTVILAVDGNIGGREMVISMASAFPDYVFKSSYKLLSLPELEKYIKQNSHLPEMPTAEEVSRDGMQVGSMTSLMVQKIEELTLHMIEMNKKIEQLQKENEQLKKGK